MSKRVLFACFHNAGRSQMAAAFFAAAADVGQVRAESGGTRPAERVHPEVVAAMGEVGLDLSERRPGPIARNGREPIELLVTMGCGDSCLDVLARERLDWPLPDPRGLPLAEVRAIRDEIRRRVEELVASRGWGRSRLPERRTPCC
jgi:arsenate reductase